MSPSPDAISPHLQHIATQPRREPSQQVPQRERSLPIRKAPRWHVPAERFVQFMALSAIAAIVLILAFLLKSSLPMWTDPEVAKEVTQAQMWFAQLWPGYDAPENVWQPVSDTPKYGLWPLLTGTIKTTLVAMAVGGPLGVAAAVFVAFYARGRTQRLLKPVLELMAAIPSVVLGFFALMTLASWMQDFFGLDSRLNALVSGVALSLAIVPVVFTLSEEAIRAVPTAYVEASTALGAARWQTLIKVVLPTAAPGIASAIALGLGRAVGETMIVLMASGNAAITSWTPLDSTRTLSATIAAELGEVVFGSAHYTVLFYLGLILFIFTSALNAVGARVIELQKIRVQGR